MILLRNGPLKLFRCGIIVMSNSDTDLYQSLIHYTRVRFFSGLTPLNRMCPGNKDQTQAFSVVRQRLIEHDVYLFQDHRLDKFSWYLDKNLQKTCHKTRLIVRTCASEDLSKLLHTMPALEPPNKGIYPNATFT